MQFESVADKQYTLVPDIAFLEINSEVVPLLKLSNWRRYRLAADA